MFNDRWTAAGLSLAGRAAFEPMTMLTALAVGATVAGGVTSAAGTLASGNYAAQAGQMERTAAYAKADEQEFEAKQLEQNAAQSFASAQREALDKQEQTRLAISSSRARAAASGVDAGVGSAATNEGDLAARGSYHALMDLYNGENARVGQLDQASATRYGAAITRYGGDAAAWEGQQKKKSSYLAAGGQMIGALGSAASGYSKLNFGIGGGANALR